MHKIYTNFCNTYRPRQNSPTVWEAFDAVLLAVVVWLMCRSPTSSKTLFGRLHWTGWLCNYKTHLYPMIFEVILWWLMVFFNYVKNIFTKFLTQTFFTNSYLAIQNSFKKDATLNALPYIFSATSGDIKLAVEIIK